MTAGTDGAASKGPVGTLSVLAVDDEVPSLDELVYLLRSNPRVNVTQAASNATEALRLLRDHPFDLVLLDVRMPGLDGLELATILSRFAEPPAIAFVTAHEEHAFDAFGVGAVDYLLKPVTADRLAALLERAVPSSREPASVASSGRLDVLAVDTGSTTRMVRREEVAWVEASGDYVRIHTKDGSRHLVRIPMVTLEEEWLPHGFVRVHRGYLVDLAEVREVRTEGARTSVKVRDTLLPVSRRHAAELRHRLLGGTQRYQQ
ncbi:MAG: LytTR family DNA-binding domain-containing protein [Actinomycetota bacterium]|jgi:DNA-binding LytR/AlgR family response regulator|nr:LytTR family DNA-binding domain-containing protein [Actinomycetota bacterium]